MEMKSVAVNRVSRGDETSAFKVAKKSTSAMKKKESTKYQMSNDDPLCGIEIYEVIGNASEEGDVDLQVKNQPDKYKKVEGSEETVVGGSEVLLRRKNQRETSEKNKSDGLTGLAYIIGSQKEKYEKGLGLRGKISQDSIVSTTGKIQKSTATQFPDKSTKIDNARIILAAQSNDERMQNCEVILTDANGGTIANLYSPMTTMNDGNFKGKERSIDKSNPMREASGEGAAGKKEIAESRRADTSGIYIAQDLGENDVGQVSARKVGIVGRCARAEEMIVPSGPSWGTEIQLGPEFYGCVGNEEDDDETGQLKIDESDSLEFIKRYVGEKFEKDGTCVKTGEGKTGEKERNDKKMIKGEETKSVAVGDGIEESARRKRTTQGEGTEESVIKKRKVECFKKNEIDIAVNEGDKGSFISEHGIKMESIKSDSEGCHKLEDTIDKAASRHLALPFLESLRGSIKSLSRADLEELIVQKLCEAISERSVVGLLRKKAEVLEKNQERWKEKVSALTKQMKEMDMVMKKYLSEVRKLQAERNYQNIAPLRVTRSVGLQVSFTSSSSKIAKVVPAVQLARGHDDKEMKRQLQRTVYIPQNPKKTIPLVPTPPVKKSLVIDQKKFIPRSPMGPAYQARVVNEAQLAAKQAFHLQHAKRFKPSTILPAGGSTQSTAELIDEERSRHLASRQGIAVRSAGQVRLVNHMQTAQGSASKMAYLLPSPTSSASGSGSSSSTGSQSQRPLSVPTTSAQSTQKHILPSAPPLLYKGSTVAQPGSQQQGVASQNRHPAPLPSTPLNQLYNPEWKQLPPRPALKISKVQTGIVLSWNMVVGEECAQIAGYQLFAYQESSAPPNTTLWKRVGEVRALPLPMACTLTQFMSGFQYYFAVRAVDVHSRVGPFSYPISIFLTN